MEPSRARGRGARARRAIVLGIAALWGTAQCAHRRAAPGARAMGGGPAARARSGANAHTAGVARTVAAELPAPPRALESWNDGSARSRILRYLEQATDPSSRGYVPLEARIAVFDHDGTLWCEQPIAVQGAYLVDALRARAAATPSLRNRAPYQAALAYDYASIHAMDARELALLGMGFGAGISPEAYAERVGSFLATARHPRFNRPFTSLTYRPMVELMVLLRARGFRTFIATGGDADFVRAISESLYGVSREAVVGSGVLYVMRSVANSLELVRTPNPAGWAEEGRGKVASLQRVLGRRPVIVVGNSDADLEMFEYAGGDHSALRVLVRHDDVEREYEYDRDATRALAAANERSWVVVSMRRDFRRVFGE